MEVHAPRSIIRHSVEMALKQLGIMDFVDEMMYEELKEKTDKLMDILCQKFNNMLRSNIKARDIFDTIDADGSGTLEEEEMKAFLEKLEIKASYQEVRVLFARIDFNLTGSLTFSEFMDRITNWKKFGKEWEKKAMQAKAQAKKKGGADVDRMRAQAGLQEFQRTNSSGLRDGTGGPPRIGRTQSKGAGGTSPLGIGRTQSKGAGGTSPLGSVVDRTPSTKSAGGANPAQVPAARRTQSTMKK